MKRLLLSLLLSIPISLHAEKYIRNENQTTYYANNADVAAIASVDRYGNQYVRSVDPSSGLSQSVIPVSNASGLNGVGVGQIGYAKVTTDTAETSSTTTVINATTHSARVGDALLFTAGAANTNAWSTVSAVTANTITLSNALPGAPANGDAFTILRPTPIGVTLASGTNNALGGMNVTLDYNTQSSIPTGILKLEDVGHTTGDAGVFSLNIVNETAASLGGSNLDYGAAAVSSKGAILPDLNTDFRISSTKSPLKPEDEAFAADSAVMMSGGQSLSALAQSVGTSGDAAPPAQDLANRQIISFAPSGEIVAGCNSAITTATTGTIIAATASKFTFVTSLSCTNTGAAATRVILEDGAGNDLANVMLAATTGFATVTFPSPVRTSVVNSVIQANVITTSSSTICCASGYVGVI